MKKFICTALTLAMVVGSLAGCGSSSSKETTAASGAATEAATEAAQTEVAAATGDFDTSKEISVNSREDGSGTRGAFIELFGVEEKAADGTKVDNTTVEANITNSTSVMMTSVAGDPYAIAHFLCVGRIWFAVVAHNRIDDDQIVRPLKITDKVGYDGNLSGGSEETGADTGEFKAKLLPFVDAGLHMISVILVVKAFKTGVI